MSDDKKTDKPSAKNESSQDDESGKWSTGAKVGAAIGSAAVAAALIYAGRHKIKKHNEFKPAKDKPVPKYENEPDYDEDDAQ
ncbi:MAG: hypothetical protein ABJF89_13240 [Parasphingorhabdus sp.]|uniref:hypothetical protein n=1 Tax=Parasphingorhabdus sp. TaxID=2709688 RepID=UPI0032652472